MNFDPNSFGLDFRPPLSVDACPGMQPALTVVNVIAEQAVIEAIVEGSGGPHNEEMTERGLRFVRYLLSPPYRQNVRLPNLKSKDCIQLTAREFILKAGSAGKAMNLLTSICEEESTFTSP